MSEKPIVKLYTDAHWVSPYVFSCFVALREKGLPFESAPIALQDGAQHDPAYRDRSLTARVPAIDDGGFWLAESQAIVEYLDDVYPERPRLLPADVRQRARARQVLGWLRSDLSALREARPTTSMFYERAQGPLPPAAREAADKLLRVAGLLVPDGALSLFGAWCIADSDLAFMLERLVLNGDEVPARLRDFAAAQWTRPSVRAFVERQRPPYVPS
jgi:glutathione S-transferase